MTTCFKSAWTNDPSFPVRVPALFVAHPILVEAHVIDPTADPCVIRVTDPPAALLADATFPQVADPSPAPITTDQRAAKFAQLDAWYAARIAAGFTFGGVAYPLDIDSRQDWHGILTLGSLLSFPVHVTALDGVTVTTMDQTTAQQAAGAALSAYVTAGQMAAQYRAKIAAAQTVPDLDSIILPA